MFTPLVRELHPGMGQAVAARTVLRTKEDGNLETWGDVAHRVAEGNADLISLLPDHLQGSIFDYADQRDGMEHHLAKATLLMSGRHLQHGDADQPNRNLEVFSNCSTAPLSALSFKLLLNGSGVGRSYADNMMLVNWDHAPNLRVVLDTSHADFDFTQDESVRDARHKYAGENVVWHEVADTREGWAKAVEIWEVMTYQKVYREWTLVLDFSQVRPKGAPIMGMQGRPSSGPKPLMFALLKCATIKGSGMKPWRQAMYVDHYLAECVLVGGARRAARMAVKPWTDKDIIGFIQAKRPIEFTGLSMDEVIAYRAEKGAPYSYLWSANNSVAVDEDFWWHVKCAKATIAAGKKPTKTYARAWAIITALTEAAYGDGTGEPGIINVDRFRQNDTGWTDLTGGDFVGSKKYQVEDETRLLLARLAKVAQADPLHMICNPCGEIPLTTLGGYCVIADVVPFHADTLDEAEDAFRVAARALIRVNLMDNLYGRETRRTNRIGVGITGIHEFAWKFFEVGFRDLVRPDFKGLFDRGMDRDLGLPCLDIVVCPEPGIRAAAFWMTLSRFSRAVQEEAKSYAAELGVSVPHTVTCIKPAGTTSKLFGLTEGWHLPAMAQYMRWVQYRSDSPLLPGLREAGYPSRDIQTYSGTTIVGFPTVLAIGELGMGDALVMADEATPEEQYEWLALGEKYWISGVDQDGEPLHAPGQDMGGQISYTLKYDPKVVGFEAFRDLLIERQSGIRCCSVMPVTDSSAYEYLPEEALTKAGYEAAMREIQERAQEDIGFEHVDCAGGACPIDFTRGEKVVATAS